MGISTNTRLIGIAIIINGELQEYKVRLHKSPWSPEKATEIITALEPCVRQYCIKRVVLSIPPAHCRTDEFLYLIDRLKQFFKQEQIEVISEASTALHVFIKEHTRKTKKKVMRALVERFPELNWYYLKEMRNKNKYYIKLFEAVGMAALYEQG